MAGEYEVLGEGRDYYEARNGAYRVTLAKGTPVRVLSEAERWLKMSDLENSLQDADDETQNKENHPAFYEPISGI
jgi:hypothetical protein